MPSHQPGAAWPGMTGPVTWLSPVHAWQIRMALRRLVVERAPGLVGDDDFVERAAALE